MFECVSRATNCTVFTQSVCHVRQTVQFLHRVCVTCDKLYSFYIERVSRHCTLHVIKCDNISSIINGEARIIIGLPLVTKEYILYKVYVTKEYILYKVYTNASDAFKLSRRTL